MCVTYLVNETCYIALSGFLKLTKRACKGRLNLFFSDVEAFVTVRPRCS